MTFDVAKNRIHTVLKLSWGPFLFAKSFSLDALTQLQFNKLIILMVSYVLSFVFVVPIDHHGLAIQSMRWIFQRIIF